MGVISQPDILVTLSYINFFFFFTGMDLTKRELENRLNAPINATSSKEQQRLKSEQNNSLQDFVNMASGLVTRLRTDTDNAQSAFKVNLLLNFHCMYGPIYR